LIWLESAASIDTSDRNACPVCQTRDTC